MTLSTGMAQSHPFFSTPEQRMALARELFFDTGERPSGLVSEAVIQSWYRCVRSGHSAQERLSVETVSKLRIDAALRMSHALREASAQGLDRLEAAIAGTPCQVILTNPESIVIYASRRANSQEERVMKNIARLGVDLSENSLGTNAPGIVAQTGQGCLVHGSEHFNDAIGTVQCAAAPIRDIHAQLVGVLNISIEGRPFGFDALALIGAYAGMIENHLVAWQSRDMLVLAFQVDPRLLGTPQAARIVVDHDGRLKWLNGIAARLTAGSVGQPVESLLGRSLDALLSAVREDQPHRLCLPNGLHVWMLARRRPEDRPAVLWPAATGAMATSPPRAATDELWRAMRRWTPVEQQTDVAARSAATTLQESQDERIARALEACGGKVARAARMLGVSRGVVYRHLRKLKT